MMNFSDIEISTERVVMSGASYFLFYALFTFEYFFAYC